MQIRDSSMFRSAEASPVCFKKNDDPKIANKRHQSYQRKETLLLRS